MDFPDWDPRDEFPSNPGFYNRVLRYLPTPIVVVDATGHIIYANDALLLLCGYDMTPDIERNIIEYIHPEDRTALAESFVELVESASAQVFDAARPWGEVHFRFIQGDGSSLPVRVTGTGGLLDDVVGGIIYEVRPAQGRDQLVRVLSGLSAGMPMSQLLAIITEMIGNPPFNLQSAILQSDASGQLILGAASHPGLAAIFHESAPDAPWQELRTDPFPIAIDQLPSPLRDRIRDTGARDLWCVGVQSPLTSTTLRILVAADVVHVPANGPIQRLIEARDLGTAVLLRTQSSTLLAQAADIDPLTQLPNRPAFYQACDASSTDTERVILHLDLDGLKTVNHEMGPAAGDAVLRVVADRIRTACGPRSILGRIGDDEFAILECAPEGQVLGSEPESLAKALLHVVADPVVVAGRSISVSASIGLAKCDAGTATDQLLIWADAAMHDAKQAGGNRIRKFSMTFG